MIFSARQPVLAIPHGGGPCFFIDDPMSTWVGMAGFLRRLPDSLSHTPQAILIVSGHWETSGFSFTGSASPSLIYDYTGFPAHTYQLRYDAPGAPALAAKAANLLREAVIAARVEESRGLDHGVFVPLKVMFPESDIPVVELSVDRHMDAAQHLAVGRALAPLRDEGVLIVGSGMSFHNLPAFRSQAGGKASELFDDWLTAAMVMEGEVRADRLKDWEKAPAARLCHPREEHLLPLLVAAGASQGTGRRIYHERIFDIAVSGFRFDD